MESSKGHKIRNFVLVASTGSGKSRTANCILGKDYFYVGDDIVSCTAQVSHATNHQLQIKVLDTPGFGDHRMEESNIDQILKDLAMRIVSFDETTTNQIDVFVLIVKLDPRPASLKEDIEHMRSLFGTRSLKSTILVPIVHYSKTPWSDKQLEDQMRQWTEINKIIGDAKGEEFNSNWYVRWDNIDKRPGQLNELLEKSKKISPYTHEMFIAAQKEIQERIDIRIKERVEKQTIKLKEKYRNEEKKMGEEIQKMRANLEKERIKRKQSARQAEQDAKDLQKQIKTMQQDSDRILHRQLKKINQEKQRQQKLLQEQLQKDTQRYKEEQAALQRKYKQEMEQMQRKLRAAERNRPVVYKKSGGCFQSSTLVIKRVGDVISEVPISSLQIGDTVLSFTEKRQLFWDEIAIIDDGRNTERQIFTIRLSGLSKPLRLTHHHHIYRQPKNTHSMIRSKASDVNVGDIMYVLDESGSKLEPRLVEEVSGCLENTPVRNVLTVETFAIVAGGVFCSVHCEGDWGRGYFRVAQLMRKYVSKEVPNYMFRLHKWVKKLYTSNLN